MVLRTMCTTKNSTLLVHTRKESGDLEADKESGDLEADKARVNRYLRLSMFRVYL